MHRQRQRFYFAVYFSFAFALPFAGAQPEEAEQPEQLRTQRRDDMIAAYFRAETERLADACLADVDSLADWEAKRPELKRQLMEMLGLDPLPEKTNLQVQVTGTADHEEFTVRRLHFQSRPGLYVTANLYVPKDATEPLPAVLYVCGHAPVKEDGVSYGNKTHYQHHGSWFARNGYVCLVLDTLQLGEIEGIHHGLYRENMWWWINRGYTPAGVEAWNCVRALDLLQSLPEVDPERLGVTGRSGGGAYSWWISAIDERIKCAVPVAGITDLENHVVDGCVEGHCDCMYMVNTYQWDYPMVAALVAPRPLLISNTDRDSIFPLDGVYRTYEKVRKIYELYDAADQVALNITAGGHDDTQELRVHAFRWLNQHLKGDDSLIDKQAVSFFQPPELKVFDELPDDERNASIHETFVRTASPAPPKSQQEWEKTKDQWRTAMKEKVFRGWPTSPGELDVVETDRREQNGFVYRTIEFTSQASVRLPMILAPRADLANPESIELHVLDEASWLELQSSLRSSRAKLPASEGADQVAVYMTPRGIGPWQDPTDKQQIHYRRRFYLLGQTLDGQRVYDVRRAIQALRAQPGLKDAALQLTAEGPMAGVALYASLFESDITKLVLHDPPASHREGPFLLNVSRYFDLPQAAAMAAERTKLVLHVDNEDDWQYLIDAAGALEWDADAIESQE